MSGAGVFDDRDFRVDFAGVAGESGFDAIRTDNMELGFGFGRFEHGHIILNVLLFGDGFMNGTVKVIGGKRLKGEVVPIPNKNSVVAALPAAALAMSDVVFKGLPGTSDVEKILAIFKQLGAEVDDSDFNNIKINSKKLSSYKVDEKLGSQFRASLNFVGPLLARFGVAEVPLPGGCDLGMRSIEAHLFAFEKVGVSVSCSRGMVMFTAPKKILPKYRVWQIEASVTATENLAIYAAGIGSDVEIIDAASEPHVTDLLTFLAGMGADIGGINSNRVRIKGKKKLGGAVFRPRPDFVDIAGYMVAAGVTDGEIRIKGANIPDVVDGIINWMEMFNLEIKREGDDLVVRQGRGGLMISKRGFPLAAPNLPKLVPRPWPGFPVDCLPPIATLASKSRGRLLLQNWMYEQGLDFVRELNSMGADILMLDPQKIIVNGPVNFKGGEVTPPSVIQSTKAVFLAALADPVTTTIHGFDILRRRYPNIVEVYRKLGAEIEVVGDKAGGVK